MTCKNCSTAIENHLNNHTDGIISCAVSLLTNKALIKHDLNTIRQRKIIEEIEDLGFDAKFQPPNESIDIREITKNEVKKYTQKFLLTFVLYIPLLVMIWIVPNVPATRPFMTRFQIGNGNSFYILLCAICSTII